MINLTTHFEEVQKMSKVNNEKFAKVKEFLNDVLCQYGADFRGEYSSHSVTVDEAIDDLFAGEQGIPTNNAKVLEKLNNIEKLIKGGE